MELARLEESWAADPQINEELRDIRRHFHTFKGNGRAVGANVLGELGWAAQDMLDRVLEGEIAPNTRIQELVKQLIASLPALVESYQSDGDFDVKNTRELTNRCFAIAKTGGGDLAAELPPVEQAPPAPTRLIPQTPAAGTITQ